MPEPRDGLARLFDVIDEPPRPEFAAALRARLLEDLRTPDAPAAAEVAVASDDVDPDHDPEGVPMAELTLAPRRTRARTFRTVALATTAAAAAVVAAYVGVSRSGDDVDTERSVPATTPTTTFEQPEVEDPDGAGPITATIDVDAVNIRAAAGGVVVAATNGKVVRLDGSTNRVLAERLLENGGAAIGAGAVWVVDRSATLHRLDIDTLQDEATVRIPGASARRGGAPGSPVVFEAGRVWLLTVQGVVAVDPASMEVVVQTALTPEPDDLTAGGGAVWVKTGEMGSPPAVVRIDPSTGSVVATIALPGHAPRMAFGAGALWVADFDHGDLLRIDPATNAIAATLDLVDEGTFGVAASDTEVWAGLLRDDTLVRIDPATGQVVERFYKIIAPVEISIA
jgi:streptogramin lyase